MKSPVPPAHTLWLPGPTPVPLRFQRVLPGTFHMGQRGLYADEEPVHTVRITREFYLGRFPVTQLQFAAWTNSAAYAAWLRGPGKKLGENPHENHFAANPEHPAENLTWHAATAFCEWLTAACGDQLPPGITAARLPTEAEWEYACRAGTTTQFYTGDDEKGLEAAAWFGEDWETGSTHPVGLKVPNPRGLYDLHGNVWEWCLDGWDEHAYKQRPNAVVDPETPAPKNPPRVVRGGSWINSARGCRAAYRVRNAPDSRAGAVGFRVCLVPGPGQASRSGAIRPEEKAKAAPATGDGRRGTSLKSDGAGAPERGRPARKSRRSETNPLGIEGI